MCVTTSGENNCGYELAKKDPLARANPTINISVHVQVYGSPNGVLLLYADNLCKEIYSHCQSNLLQCAEFVVVFS